MAHVARPQRAPDLEAPLVAHPETERHLNGLAETLLRGPSSLTPAEREVIAGCVTTASGCSGFRDAHAAKGRHLLGPPPVSEKLRALLVIAGKVQQGGRHLTDDDLARARLEGADDKAIHDTVLIAAAFCMFDRYEAAVYGRIGADLTGRGYRNSIGQQT